MEHSMAHSMEHLMEACTEDHLLQRSAPRLGVLQVGLQLLALQRRTLPLRLGGRQLHGLLLQPLDQRRRLVLQRRRALARILERSLAASLRPPQLADCLVAWVPTCVQMCVPTCV